MKNTLIRLCETHQGCWTNDNGEGFREEVSKFKSYFEKAWIGAEVRNRGRRNPTWTIAKWNKFNQVVAEDFVLTNNGNEVFNSSWVPSLPKNATVWSVIKGFQKEESFARVTHAEYQRAKLKRNLPGFPNQTWPRNRVSSLKSGFEFRKGFGKLIRTL